jgi:dUTP pyrophosphatase
MSREKKNIYIEKCHKNGQIPVYMDGEDAGADVALCEDIEIKPYETKLVGLGIKVAIPKGFELQLRPRSGLSYKTSLRIPNSPGTVDTNYRDELKAILHNSGKETLKFKRGDRIGQLVLNEVPKAIYVEIENIKKIKGDRGGGIGSTNLNLEKNK